MIKQYLDAVRKPGQTVNPLFNLLGVVVERIDDGEAVLRLPPHEGHVQGAGAVAGGVLATLGDEAMAHAVLSALPPGKITATAELGAHYLHPARPGATLVAEATLLRRGGRVIFAQADIRDEAGVHLARISGTFVVSDDPRTTPDRVERDARFD